MGCSRKNKTKRVRGSGACRRTDGTRSRYILFFQTYKLARAPHSGQQFPCVLGTVVAFVVQKPCCLVSVERWAAAFVSVIGGRAPAKWQTPKSTKHKKKSFIDISNHFLARASSTERHTQHKMSHIGLLRRWHVRSKHGAAGIEQRRTRHLS